MLRPAWLCLLFGVLSLNGVSGLATLSIDLSSEFLKVAIVKPGVPMEIVLNKESRRKTPLSVAFKDGETLLGDSALVVAIKKPKQSFSYFLDLLAKDLKNPIVQKFQKDYPQYTLGEEDGRVYFEYNEDTKYFPEELVAIALNASRETAEDYAEQKITDAVITVPSFFNQAERKAVLYAADLAGLRVLQLLSENAAVALNYGVFRRKEFNGTIQHVMFFDMGASSTTASIVGFQTVKSKEEGIAEINPQLTIKGVGFDRTLGGKELDLKMQAHLAKLFTDQKKTSSSVYESPRAMAKLLKEAKRVKQVLSANTDHTAQIEGLLDDQDFKAHVTRKELVEMSKDFYGRVEGVIERVLKSADMTLIEIDSVILVGGGTRVPKVQEVLLKATKKKELAKNINADEAAALGAVYQAAHLSKGFKVKKFLVKDASIFPIQVEFDKISTEDDGSESKRTVKRTLFHQNNVMPQKKVMTFNKHKEDFNLRVNYGDLQGSITKADLEYFGSLNLSVISLKGIPGALSNHTEDDSKGIKAHFRMDESGILHLDSVEAVFERLENVTVNETEVEEQSTFAKLGDTISRFFSGSSGDEKAEEPTGEVKDDGTTEEEKVVPEDTAEKDEATEREEGETSEEQAADDMKEETGEDAEEGQDDEKQEAEKGDGDDEDEEESKEEETAEEDSKEEGEEEDESEEETEKEEAGDDDDEKKEGEEDQAEEQEKEESKEADEDKAQEKEEDQDSAKEDKKTKKKDKGKKDKKDKDKKDKDAKKDEKDKPTKPQIQTVKEPITFEVEMLDVQAPTKEVKKASKAKLKELRKIQDDKRAKEQAVNSLESFIYETQEKLYEEEYEACSLEEDRDAIRANLSEASDWIYDVDADANATVFKQKLKELKKLTKDLFFRVKEKQERPELISAMKSALNTSKVFLQMIKNVTEEDESPFTKVEIELLEKVYNKSKEWFSTKMKEQKKLADHEKPVLLTSDLKDKIADIDRELRYLVGKAKTTKPKKKPSKDKSSNKTEEAKKSNETKADDEETEQTELPAEDAPPEETKEDEVTEAGETEDQEEEPPQEEPEGDAAEEEPLQIGGGEEDAQIEEPAPVDTPPEQETKPEDDEVSTEETDPADATTTEKQTAHNSGDL